MASVIVEDDVTFRIPYFIEELETAISRLPDEVIDKLALGTLSHSSCRLCGTFLEIYGDRPAREFPEEARDIWAYHNAKEFSGDRSPGSEGMKRVLAIMQARSFLIYEISRRLVRERVNDDE